MPLTALFGLNIIIPPTLKKFVGILLLKRACVCASVRASHFFVSTVTFKPLKLVLKFHIWIPYNKNCGRAFFSFPSYLPFWSYDPLILS